MCMYIYIYMVSQCRLADIVRGEGMRGLGVKMDATWLFCLSHLLVLSGE